MLSPGAPGCWQQADKGLGCRAQSLPSGGPRSRTLDMFNFRVAPSLRERNGKRRGNLRGVLRRSLSLLDPAAYPPAPAVSCSEPASTQPAVPYSFPLDLPNQTLRGAALVSADVRATCDQPCQR